MKKIFFFLLYALPLFCFSQKKVEDFFNNRIDFVLDNNDGRAFMGAVVKEYIIDDSLSDNNAYNKIGIQPFYRYSQSKFLSKNLLTENETVRANKGKTEFEYNGYIDSKTYVEYFLNMNSLGSFNIKSKVEYINGRKLKRTSLYEPFKNFELSFFTKKKNVNGILSKNLYGNVTIAINGISFFEKNSINNMIFFNTLTIKLNDSDTCSKFLISIYEAIGMNSPYLEGYHYYLGTYPNIIMRKLEITGNKEDAIKFLKKNKLDYNEIDPQNYKEENFRKKDN